MKLLRSFGRLPGRRIRTGSAPDPHLKHHRIHRIRLQGTALGRSRRPDPHVKHHRIHWIRLKYAGKRTNDRSSSIPTPIYG